MGTIFELNSDTFDGPKYKAVVEMLRDHITAGTLKVGDKVPPVRDLAWDLKMTPGTVARAYQEATSEGLLEATVGRGTFVAGNKAPQVGSGGEIGLVRVPTDVVNLRNSNTTNVGQGIKISQAMMRVAKSEAQNYIFYPGFEGRHPIYPYLSKWMEYSLLDVDPEDIILTHGGQNAISLAMQAIIGHSKAGVAIDALAYPGVRYAVQAQGGILHGVEIDEHGLIPTALEKVCRSGGIRAIFTSANVLNPTTGCMPLSRRIEIADIARKYDLQIIEDDCWGIGPAEYTGFHSICPERTWYLTSFTKNVTSGLRFGWLVCPKDKVKIAQRIMRISSFGVSRAVSDIAYELMKSGDAHQIREDVMRAVSAKVQETVNMLGQWNITFRKDIPFIWLELPVGWRASAFAAACERSGVVVRPADEFSLKDSAIPHAVRISVNNHLPDDVFTDALKAISNLLANPPMVVEG